jgi:dipeptidyl aminopeptidase/acylaminoacyl peptidase
MIFGLHCRVAGLITVLAFLGPSLAMAGAHTAPKDFVPVPVDKSKELPTRIIPNIPAAAEAYYAPDDYHLIAQTQDPDAQRPEGERVGGALTYIFTDDGKVSKRINDRGQDACSYFFPDQKRIVWTSTRDNMEMPLGNWSSQDEYPQGSELYISDLDGNNIVRLTDNDWYEAEVSISPNGEWIVFGRQIDGNLNLWRMRPDGSDEQQITFTEDWQPGAPFYLPDNETIMFRAWRASEYGKVRPTPMTVFTIKHDGTELTQRTFDKDMNWAPYPAPDGRHYVFVKIVDGYNWEVYLGDLASQEQLRLTHNIGFDGLPSLSKNGKKMLFARSNTGRTNLGTYVMDVSSLDLGPENFDGVPDTPVPDDAMIVTDFNSGTIARTGAVIKPAK